MSILSGVLKGIGAVFPPAGMIGGALEERDARKADKNALNIQNLASDREYQRQKEFAQRQIQWRTADAKAAGLHPLYALGQASAAYSPQLFIPGQSPSGSFATDGYASSLGSAFAAKRDPYEVRLLDAQIRREEALAGIAEQELAAKIRAATQPGVSSNSRFGPNAWSAVSGAVPASADVVSGSSLVPRVAVKLPSGRNAAIFNPTIFDELSQLDMLGTFIWDRVAHGTPDREYYRRIRKPRKRTRPDPKDVTEARFWDYQ